MKTKQQILADMQKNARDNSYFLCPDKQLLDTLIEGLFVNHQRYGYGSCPCRIASGNKTYDSDIICPCEYRDADVDEYGMCYCGLFVNKEKYSNPSLLGPIPERRPIAVQDAALGGTPKKSKMSLSQNHGEKPEEQKQEIVVWRCSVCGYLCARETPPPLCPICKARSERFERFNIV